MKAKRIHPLKLIFIITGIVMLFQFHSAGQSIYQKSYNTSSLDYGTDVKQTSDSGYIMGGYTNGITGDDILLIKTDQLGDTLWTRTYGSTSDDRLTSVIQSSDGGYVFSGNSTASSFLMKTDSNGILQWNTYFGMYLSYGYKVIETSDGAFVSTGYYDNSTGTHDDIYLVKVDTGGNMVWIKAYQTIYKDRATCVVETSDNGFMIAGTSSDLVGNDQIRLIKTNAVGDTLWTNSYGGNSDETGYSVVQSDDGGYVVIGSSQSFSLGGIYGVKTDSVGTIVWSRVFGGSDFEYSHIEKTTDSAYAIFGEYGPFNVPYLIKVDTSGSTIWSQVLTSVNAAIEHAGAGHMTFDGGYIFVATRDDSQTDEDAFLIKTDSLGMSSCPQANGPNIIVSNPATQSFNFGMTVLVPTTNVGQATLNTGSGGFDLVTLCSGVGIQSVPEKNLVTIKPNPATGHFNISFQKTIAKGTLEIFDLAGKSVLRENIINESEKEIDLKQVAPGIYFVKVGDWEMSYCSKVVVEQE